jgi:uncharacterized membrane protein YkvA (DUF1232 family)
MKVSFELSASDIRYFRDRLKQVRKSESSRDEQLVIRGAAKLVTDAVAAKPPDFVVERILRLEQLIEMLRDREWRLEGRDRAHILDALAYFVDPDDLIPDRIPGIGYLDDAIMIELVARELTHEIEAYEDFCEYRKRSPKTEDEARLEARREALQARMRRRRRRERSIQRSGPRSSRSPLRLW